MGPLEANRNGGIVNFRMNGKTLRNPAALELQAGFCLDQVSPGQCRLVLARQGTSGYDGSKPARLIAG
jgi:hypothetical protein